MAKRAMRPNTNRVDTAKPVSAYDPVAEMYDVFWADWFFPAALPALERLFFSRVSPNSRVLDLCCGSGHVTAELVSRGYRVTGIDNSQKLVELARQKISADRFVVADARQLPFGRTFEAVISTFDSLNHLLTLADLRSAFESVRSVLRTGGQFVFDVNLEEAYFADLHNWTTMVKDSDVALVKGQYNKRSKHARTELIWFHEIARGGNWRRVDACVEQRCYTYEELSGALNDMDFRIIEAVLGNDVGVRGDLGFGRLFVRAEAQVCGNTRTSMPSAA